MSSYHENSVMPLGTTVTLAPRPAVEATSLAAPTMRPSLSTASSSSNLSAPESTMWSAQSSRRSSANSLASVPMAVSASADNLAKPAQSPQPLPQQQPGPKTGQSSQRQKTDPLLRTYPKPENEINVSEALRRAPLKWTLGYWAKNARDLPPAPAPAAASPAALLEQKKQELRRAQHDLDQAVQRKP